MTSKLKV